MLQKVRVVGRSRIRAVVPSQDRESSWGQSWGSRVIDIELVAGGITAILADGYGDRPRSVGVASYGFTLCLILHRHSRLCARKMIKLRWP